MIDQLVCSPAHFGPIVTFGGGGGGGVICHREVFRSSIVIKYFYFSSKELGWGWGCQDSLVLMMINGTIMCNCEVDEMNEILLRGLLSGGRKRESLWVQ